MKLISWNVNGIRAAIKKGFDDFFAAEKPDIMCLQEVKAFQEQVDLKADGYHVLWNPARKPGYSGTAVFSRVEPASVTMGIGIEEHDREGRVITAEYDDFYLVNVYTPNSQRELARLEYRQQWDVDFLAYLKNLEKTKAVVFCGDLNVAHKEIDLANPKSNERNAGFTIEERDGFTRIVESGFIDTFREFNLQGDNYTWWSYMGRAREKNVGWRIDYFCISPSLRDGLQASEIMPEVMGSDHCPVKMTIG